MEDLQSLVGIPRIWERLAVVEERLLEASTADDPYLTKIAQHLLLAGGKRFRPLLALLASEFGDADGDRPVEAGVAVELIHVGSLYHDDVIDEADTRRGATSANANWTNTVAILAGDFLMARASEVAARRPGETGRSPERRPGERGGADVPAERGADGTPADESAVGTPTDESAVGTPTEDQAVEPGLIGGPAPGGRTSVLVGYGPRATSTTRRPRKGGTGATPAAASAAAAQQAVQTSMMTTPTPVREPELEHLTESAPAHTVGDTSAGNGLGFVARARLTAFTRSGVVSGALVLLRSVLAMQVICRGNYRRRLPVEGM